MDMALSFQEYIELFPKPEDVGRIKISVTVVVSDTTTTTIGPATPTGSPSYNFIMMNDWLCVAGIPQQLAHHANYQLHKAIADLFSENSSSLFDCSFSVDMTCKLFPRVRIEDVIQASLDNETTKFKPASRLVVGSLSRKVYKKMLDSKASTTICRICFEEFKDGETITTLPCGHEFDDKCIVEWLSTGHVCPLCRFEFPCEETN